MNYSRRTKISTTTGLRQIKILNLGARIGSHTRGGAQFQRIALLLVWLRRFMALLFQRSKGHTVVLGIFCFSLGKHILLDYPS
jgi:hypothetical protein